MATPEPYKDSYLDDVKPPPGFFDEFRVGNFPTLYRSIKTSESSDILLAGFIFAAVIVVFSVLLIVPGVRRWHRRLSTVIRIVVAVGFMVFIMLCNFGQGWEVGYLTGVHTQYKALLTTEIKATVGVHIGLRAVNITLLGEPRVQHFEREYQNETIDYNERFSWDSRGWLLFRAFFGPSAGRFNQEFREAQRKGLPYPILWIAEYFTIDGEGIRWGRFYLQAGFFTHVMLWAALPLWWLTLILFNMVPRYGGYFSIMTGAALLIGNIIWAAVRNPLDLAFPMYFEGCRQGASDNTGCIMKLHYAWCFWLCLVTGICCVIIGVVVVVMDLRANELLFEFFNVDVAHDYDEFVVKEDEEDADNETRRRLAKHRPTTVKPIPAVQRRAAPQSPTPGTSASNDVELQNYQPDDHAAHEPNFAFRKRTTRGLSRVQKTRKTRPESFFPPEYDNNVHPDGRTGRDNQGADVDNTDDDMYVNAQRA